MQALVIPNLSGPDALVIKDMPEPTLHSRQTLVRVSACGMNFADLMSTHGRYPGTPEPPLIAGREFAGVEESTGRRVMGYVQHGRLRPEGCRTFHYGVARAPSLE